jgi:hypothetical protein
MVRLLHRSVVSVVSPGIDALVSSVLAAHVPVGFVGNRSHVRAACNDNRLGSCQ